MAYVPLCQLREGQYGIIRSITCSKEEKPYKQAILQRFLDLGFCEETPIQCINTGIFHNPHAYKIRGSVLAIRNEDTVYGVIGIALEEMKMDVYVEPLAENCKL